MKKFFSLLLSLSLFTAPAAQAIDLADFDNIDAIMEDNALAEAANRYSAVQLSYFPENATRLGFESANNKLDQRTHERDAQALRAYTIVAETLKDVNRKNLSEAKKTEYDMLQARLSLDRHNMNRDLTSRNPLLYTQAFDAIYDLSMKQITYTDLQDRDLSARLISLVTLAKQAKENLVSPASFLAQLAMEDAYYAYLAYDAIPRYLIAQAQDDVSRSQVKADARASRQAVKEMFELFKQLAQDNQAQDFRLGEREYFFILKNRYFIEAKPRAMGKYLTKNFRTAQANLAQALSLFALPLSAEEAEMVVEEIQVPGEEHADGVTVTALDTQEDSAKEQTEPKKEKKKKKDKNAPLVKASDFYTLSSRLVSGVNNQDFLQALSNEAGNLAKFFAQDDTLPTAAVNFSVKQLPAYYAYSRAYLFLPQFGTQGNAASDLFLRLPSGNELTQQEMLNRDLNVFTLKLLMAGQLVPGRMYRSEYAGRDLSSFRKIYPVPTLANGWEVYAQHLANERGYIVTDEEELFLAWADYVRAATALVDFYVHTLHFTYAEALSFLTQTHGFSQVQAESILKDIARRPGEAVSYIYGYEALKNLRAKYQKKQGKKFSLADFHDKVISIGDIPPARLEAEMENAYKLEKSHMTKALSTPFYLD